MIILDCFKEIIQNYYIFLIVPHSNLNKFRGMAQVIIQKCNHVVSSCLGIQLHIILVLGLNSLP